ncbi:olfactory receptor 143-like [Tachyglossus aculeatus]|uniref:olfactory receptor 143-like n=1 Tax=Tachyglossus aculeatus TaxID=9261 RepID=UPI0018F29DDC|nr:olfactory receptor 143-like [Tachyglossus aculeatus]
MEERNCTTAAQLILLGLTDQPEVKLVVFLMFLTIHVTILVGNLTMVTLIEISPQLHSSMYFFLRNLSLLVVVYSSGIVSKVLINYLLETKVISFGECVVQFFFLSFYASMELFLATMTYDWFIAICHPLLYTVIMPKEVCILLVASSNLLSCVSAVVHTSSLFRLLFGSSNIINQPTSTKSMDQGKMVAVFYTLVILMYNPLIYTLRNKEVKGALKKTKIWKLFSQ